MIMGIGIRNLILANSIGTLPHSLGILINGLKMVEDGPEEGGNRGSKPAISLGRSLKK